MANRVSVKPLRDNQCLVSYARISDNFSGNTEWQARIVSRTTVENKVIWQCSHRHPGREFAIKCGNTEFARLHVES